MSVYIMRIINCKNCRWLRYYDGYFCGNGDAKTDEAAFIDDIEKENCSKFKQRDGKFWTSDDGWF